MKALTLRLDDKLWRRLSMEAIRRETSRSEIIRDAIRHRLDAGPELPKDWGKVK